MEGVDKVRFQRSVFVSVYLTLAEGQTGVDVFTVNPLQEAAAPVQHRLLLPRLKVTEQLIVHLYVAAVCISLSETLQTGRPLDTPPWILLPLYTLEQLVGWQTGPAASPRWPMTCSCFCCDPS